MLHGIFNEGLYGEDRDHDGVQRIGDEEFGFEAITQAERLDFEIGFDNSQLFGERNNGAIGF